MRRTSNVKNSWLGWCLGTATATVFALVGASPASADEGTILGAGDPGTIEGQYIVGLEGQPSVRSGTEAAVRTQAHRLADRYGGDVIRVYSSVLRGFAVEMNRDQAERLSAHPDVRYVEQDGTAHTTVTWGLDRIDQRNLPLDDSFAPSNHGAGVTAYVVDTGMDLDHPNYGGRANSGYDFVDGDSDASDCQGHGTHVGGTVGSNDYGVANQVDLVAVRVLDCGGTAPWSTVIDGIDWVTQNASGPSVGNMSIGGGKNTSVNQAVADSIDTGVSWVVAAGNYDNDACTVSPASAPGAITVAASDQQDDRSIWFGGQASNWGSCVDLFAPGTSITSTTDGGGTGQMSGTSMASPHVAGAVAVYLSAHPSAAPSQVSDGIESVATSGRISDRKGSPNLLLYAKDLGDDGGEPGEPVAEFSADCPPDGLSCSFDGSGSSDPDGPISLYAWEFGDGETGSGMSPSHTYDSAGRYTVELTVTDDDGNTDTISHEVTVGSPDAGEPPRAEFTVWCQFQSGCGFDGSGSADPDGDIASYAWEFGDGSTGSGETTSHTYTSGGSYTATLTVTDATGNTDAISRQLRCFDIGAEAFCFPSQ